MRDEPVAELHALPSRLREVVGSRDADELTRREGANWSVIEVVRHVRDVVQVYGMRFKWMILDDSRRERIPRCLRPGWNVAGGIEPPLTVRLILGGGARSLLDSSAADLGSRAS